ncbi:MAG: glycosyltransferase family 4 protein [Bacillota bacterium]|nr:glycosyltransferase family 4 protein [Bacillota bacterium]
MRILFINTFYYPNMMGGAEQSVKLLAEGLAAKGHAVGVYTIDSRTGEPENTVYNGVKVFRRGAGKFKLFKISYEKNKVGRLEKIIQKVHSYYNPVALKQFREIAAEFKPDIVHTNTLFGYSDFIWKAAKQMGIATVHTVRDTGLVLPVQYGTKVPHAVVEIHKRYIRYISRYVDAITSPSNYTLTTSLSGGGFENAIVKKCIFNSVPVDMAELDQCIKERKQRTDKIIKFLYAGRLIPNKGIKQMIESFINVNPERCTLHICGDGQLKEYVLDQVRRHPNIVYCGKLDSESLKQKYRECDVLIFPSVWPEPFGRVFIEGNMYGMPVIAGNCGGIPEIYKVTHGGELVDCNNEKEFTEKIKQYLDRSYFNQFYDPIYHSIFVFDIEKQINSFELVYREITEIKS